MADPDKPADTPAAGGRPATPTEAEPPAHPEPLEPDDPAAVKVEPGSLATRDPAEGADEDENQDGGASGGAT